MKIVELRPLKKQERSTLSLLERKLSFVWEQFDQEQPSQESESKISANLSLLKHSSLQLEKKIQSLKKKYLEANEKRKKKAFHLYLPRGRIYLSQEEFKQRQREWKQIRTLSLEEAALYFELGSFEKFSALIQAQEAKEKQRLESLLKKKGLKKPKKGDPKTRKKLLQEKQELLKVFHEVKNIVENLQAPPILDEAWRNILLIVSHLPDMEESLLSEDVQLLKALLHWLSIWIWEVKDLLSCPLTGTHLKNPTLASDGYYYEEGPLLSWMAQNKPSPFTDQPLSLSEREDSDLQPFLDHWHVLHALLEPWEKTPT